MSYTHTSSSLDPAINLLESSDMSNETMADPALMVRLSTNAAFWKV